MIVKCRTAIKVYLTLCPSVMLNNLSSSFTSIFFFTKWCVMFKSKLHWCVCTSMKCGIRFMSLRNGSCFCFLFFFYIAAVYASTWCNTHIAVVIWVDHRISNFNISRFTWHAVVIPNADPNWIIVKKTHEIDNVLVIRYI